MWDCISSIQPACIRAGKKEDSTAASATVERRQHKDKARRVQLLINAYLQDEIRFPGQQKKVEQDSTGLQYLQKFQKT